MASTQVGERIRELREIHNYTREGLAEKVDISSKFLYEIEVGRKNFSADTLVRLSKALSVSCDYIMFGEETEHRSAEKVICILEMMGPKQISRLHDVIILLSKLCDVM